MNKWNWKWDWKGMLEFARSFVRPYLAYLFSTALVGLAIYAFIKFADAMIARDLIRGFIDFAFAVAFFYFGWRSGKPREK